MQELDYSLVGVVNVLWLLHGDDAASTVRPSFTSIHANLRGLKQVAPMVLMFGLVL